MMLILVFVFSSAFPEQLCSSRSSNSDLRAQTGGDKNIKPSTSTITPSSNKTPHWDNNGNLDPFSLTSPCAGPSIFSTPNTPARGKVALNHRSKQTLHQP